MSTRGNLQGSALSCQSVVAYLIARADEARDQKRYRDAAALYGEALVLDPGQAGLHVQRGHMLKEAGELAGAEASYLQALSMTPDDADLALQLGHFYKVCARLAQAHEQYTRALRLRPGWEDPAHELAFLRKSGWRGRREAGVPPDEFQADAPPVPPSFEGRTAAEISRLQPALAPRRPEELLHQHDERIEVRRLGRRESGYWGARRTLRGVQAIRGFCISAKPLVEVQVLLNGLAIHRGPLKGGYVLKFESDKQRVKKYVFNVWLDFSPFAHGLHALELRFIEDGGARRSFHEQVVIAEPVPESAAPRSNALVEIAPDDPRSIEEQIRTRPSMVQPAQRALFPDGIRNVLVMRTDQLGDMVASIPAVRRLREIVGSARIVGLVTGANADLARTLELFDEVIVVDFPDDKTERRRLMPLDVQEALRRRLEPYRFDIALDLAQSNVSRDLLPLSGARFLYGTGGEDWPWLSADIMFNTRDPWNGMDNTPHSTKVLGLVEALGALIAAPAPIIRREDLSRSRLTPYGLAPGDRYAVLHTGARIGFSRWPHYPQLASMLLERTGLKVVMMADDPSSRGALAPELMAHPRFVLVDGRLPFDDFDAFLSFATVVVGNDSGPKHLAALRGTKVVTIFTARINWTEWGQETVGAIISRRVPCAGCAIFHDPEECGKDFACVVDIRPEEVFEAAMAYVDAPQDVPA